MKALLLFALVLPLTAFADSPFDGTWVMQTDSAALPKKPEVFVLDKGVFQAKSWTPPVKVKADGTDQKVSGHAYYDTVAVRIVDANTTEVTAKKAGKIMWVNTTTVSTDGKTATIKWSDQTGTETATGEDLYTRVAAGPKGSASISGSWRATKIESASANSLTSTYKATADGLKWSTPTGQSYDAKFDGKWYAVAGDPGQTMVSVKKVNANTIVETDKRLGKVVDVSTMTVAADGATMHVSDEDKLHGTSSSYSMKKSP